MSIDKFPPLSTKSEWIKDHLPAQRAKLGLALVEGPVLCGEALVGSWEVDTLLLPPRPHAHSAVEEAGTRAGVPMRRATSEAIARLSTLDSCPPCAALVRVPEPVLLDARGITGRVLYLDALADPGNVGTLVRAAAAFGFTVALGGGGVAPRNEKLIRASAGLIMRKGLVTACTPDSRERVLASGADVVLLAAEAPVALHEILTSRDARRALVLVVGSEAHGLDPSLWPGARSARIPMAAGVESLNAAVSGSIAMYEAAQGASR